MSTNTAIPTSPNNVPKVVYIGLSFTIMFTAYISAQNLISILYKELKYDGLGQICLLTIYGFLGFGSVFAAYIKRQVSYRVGLAGGAIGYAFLVTCGAFTAGCSKYELDITICNTGFIYFFNIVSSMLVGFGGSVLWLTQADYVNTCADESTRGKYNGIFWSLMQLSQIIGSVMATFVLGTLDPFTFYIILMCFSIVSIVMFLFIPNLEKRGPKEENNQPLGEAVKQIFVGLVGREYLFLNAGILVVGVVIAYYASYLSFIVKSTLPAGEDDNYINERVGFVLIALACGEVSAGYTIGKMADKFNKANLLHIAIIIAEFALVVSYIAYVSGSYVLCLLAGYIWGYSDTALNTMFGAIIGSYFNGRLELFGIIRVLTGAGALYGIVIGLEISSVTLYTILMGSTMLLLHIGFISTKPKLSEEGREGPLLAKHNLEDSTD